jgi:hypothetical protein
MTDSVRMFLGCEENPAASGTSIDTAFAAFNMDLPGELRVPVWIRVFTTSRHVSYCQVNENQEELS